MEAARNSASVASRSGTARSRQARAFLSRAPPVQLAVRPAHAVPGVGSADEVQQEVLSLDVLRQPPTQARPHLDQRLVGDLDTVSVDAHQPRVDELFQEMGLLVVGGDLGEGHPGTDRAPVLGGDDQAQQELTQARPLRRVHRFVECFGGQCHGVPDAAGRAVPLDGQRLTLTALPDLPQHVREHGQRRRLSFDVAYQEVDESRLQSQPGTSRGAFDGIA